MERYYEARLSTLTKVSSAFTCLVVTGAVIFLLSINGEQQAEGILSATVVLVGVALAALFAVRGYVVTERELLIRRLLWTTRIPLQGLVSAQADPAALKRGTVRLCGNSGLFAITGFFWNRRIGRFRAYATDPAATVVLRFARRTIVVSPSDPEDFVKDLGLRKNS